MIIRQCFAQRLPLPAKIRDAPELQPGLELYYAAFFDLGTTRQMGMGEGPIPWWAIHDYCTRLEIEGEQRDDMLYHVQMMDEVYLDHVAKKAKAKK